MIIFFAEISGRKNVCFRNTASLIISDKWYEERNSNVDEVTRILDTAAKLIKNSLRIAVLLKMQPNSDGFQRNFVGSWPI